MAIKCYIWGFQLSADPTDNPRVGSPGSIAFRNGSVVTVLEPPSVLIVPGTADLVATDSLSSIRSKIQASAISVYKDNRPDIGSKFDSMTFVWLDDRGIL